MKTTDITIKIESSLAREAKQYATQQGVTLSHLVAEQLELLVRNGRDYVAVRKHALFQLRKGFDLGWEKPASRVGLHDRTSQR